jgi:hypothetical protein
VLDVSASAFVVETRSQVFSQVRSTVDTAAFASNKIALKSAKTRESNKDVCVVLQG